MSSKHALPAADHAAGDGPAAPKGDNDRPVDVRSHDDCARCREAVQRLAVRVPVAVALADLDHRQTGRHTTNESLGRGRP